MFDLTEFVEYAATVTRGHTPEQEPLAEERANVYRPDSATAASTDKWPSCSVTSLDSKRKPA